MLSSISQALAEDVFNLQDGYVLNFQSRKAFQSFIAGIVEIDVENQDGYCKQSSMAKKLRYLMANEDDETISKVLLQLLEKRAVLIADKEEFDPNFRDVHSKSAERLRREVDSMTAQTSVYSSNQERLSADIKSAKSMLEELISALKLMVCNHSCSYNKNENEINDYLRDLLKQRGAYSVIDQTRHGESESGKDAGEVDILLSRQEREVALIECLKLESVNTNTLDTHIQKAIKNYNPLGTPTFIIMYVGSKNFSEFWSRCYAHLTTYEYGMDVDESISEEVQDNASIKVAYLTLKKNDFVFPVHFVAVDLYK